MNNDRRKKIEDLRNQLDDIKGHVESLKDEEQDYFDNMPENLQQGEKGQIAEAAIDALDSATQSCDEALSYLDEATN